MQGQGVLNAVRSIFIHPDDPRLDLHPTAMVLDKYMTIEIEQRLKPDTYHISC